RRRSAGGHATPPRSGADPNHPHRLCRADDRVSGVFLRTCPICNETGPTGGKISVGGQEYQLEILLRDTQSDPNRASEVASELILKDDVNLMLSGAAPETTNPVADQCEVNG